MNTQYPQVGTQQVGTRTTVVCDGKVTVLTTLELPEPGTDNVPTFVVTVKIGDVTVHEVCIEADDINAVKEF